MRKTSLATLALAALALAGCGAMENARQAVARTGDNLGQKIEKADTKVSGPIRRSRAQQAMDNAGAKVDHAVDSTLKRN